MARMMKHAMTKGSATPQGRPGAPAFAGGAPVGRVTPKPMPTKTTNAETAMPPQRRGAMPMKSGGKHCATCSC